MTDDRYMDEELARLLREHHEQHDGDAGFRFCSCPCCLEQGRQRTAFLATLLAMFEGRLP